MNHTLGAYYTPHTMVQIPPTTPENMPVKATGAIDFKSPKTLAIIAALVGVAFCLRRAR